VKRILASYRWRRRLMWLTITAAVVGGALAIGFIWPNTAPPQHLNPTGGPAKVYATPKAVRLKLRERAAALVVVSRFVDSAVARHDVDRAWGMVTPEMHAGYTRKQWDTQPLPDIAPFPVAQARWQLQFSDTSGVGFTVALFPPRKSQQQPIVFMVGLHEVGARKHRHWLIDNWQPAPINATASGGGGSVSGQFAPQLGASASPSPGSKAKEGPIWLLLPVGLLSLILVIPLSIAGLNWRRDRRARAAFGE
jgi:hypothetical protein